MRIIRLYLLAAVESMVGIIGFATFFGISQLSSLLSRETAVSSLAFRSYCSVDSIAGIIFNPIPVYLVRGLPGVRMAQKYLIMKGGYK
jgi:hypothetical protein